MAINKSEFLSGLGKFKTKQDAYNDSIFAKKTDVASGVSYKGTVASFANLPESGNTLGDMYNISTAGGTDADGIAIKAGDNVVWNGTGWDNYGGTVDISGKVDKVQGKQLSTEDYTTAEKEKLAAIGAGAQVNVIETVKVDGTSLAVTGKAVDIDLSRKVDKVTGKGLSTNDFTDALKTKLEGITEETITQADIDALFTTGEGE